MPEYLTVSEACDLARISRSTFYKLLADPDSELATIAIRIPGIARLRIPEQAFREWMTGTPTRKKKARKAQLQPCISSERM